MMESSALGESEQPADEEDYEKLQSITKKHDHQPKKLIVPSKPRF